MDSECIQGQECIRHLLAEQGLDALLQRASSFAWATCGVRADVNIASTVGAAALLITPTERHLITDNLEAARLEDEGDVFALAMREYAGVGMLDAWHEHHQGGAAGYELREFLVTPSMQETVVPGQAFVWNPSLGGACSMDLFIVREEENRIVSHHDAWSVHAYEVAGRLVLHPAVLVR